MVTGAAGSELRAGSGPGEWPCSLGRADPPERSPRSGHPAAHGSRPHPTDPARSLVAPPRFPAAPLVIPVAPLPRPEVTECKHHLRAATIPRKSAPNSESRGPAGHTAGDPHAQLPGRQAPHLANSARGASTSCIPQERRRGGLSAGATGRVPRDQLTRISRAAALSPYPHPWCRPWPQSGAYRR
jgi:hypothetical protein